MARLPPATLSTLQDGRVVRIRPIVPEDATRLMALHERLSLRSVRSRFFSPMPHLAAEFAARLCAVDWKSRFAFVVSEPTDDVIYGVGRFEGESARSGEVAFVVEDALQGLGIGPVLLGRIVAQARKGGYERLTATVLAENSSMLTVFREAAFPVEFHSERDLTFVKIDIRSR